MTTATRPAGSAGAGAAPVKRRAREMLDAAAAVFAEKSFHGSSTQDIADRLGIRQASLYYYFRSKDEALAEVCRQGVAGFLETARSIAARQESAARRVEAIIASHLRPANMKPAYVKVFLTERQHVTGAARKEIGRIARAYEKAIESLLRSGVEAGEFSAAVDPRLATLALLGMCNEASRWVGTRRGASVEATASAYANLLLSGLRGER